MKEKIDIEGKTICDFIKDEKEWVTFVKEMYADPDMTRDEYAELAINPYVRYRDLKQYALKIGDGNLYKVAAIGEAKALEREQALLDDLMERGWIS